MFENLILEKHPTGSNYICNPPVTTTDIDFVCLLNEGDLKVAKAFAIGDGWELCGKEYETLGDFLAFRKDRLNYICVDKEEVYNKWIAATEEAKSLNLLNKEDRIKCFEKHLGVKEKNSFLWGEPLIPAREQLADWLNPVPAVEVMVGQQEGPEYQPDISYQAAQQARTRTNAELIVFFNEWMAQRNANRQW